MTRGGGIAEPRLPPGRAIELPGLGTTFVRELEGPSLTAPAIMLLHGWTASADLNWFLSYFPLSEHFRVVALDHRGHGGGIRSRKLFRLEDCADDAVALADVLGIDRFIPVGYSMGGPVAQLVWRRHRERVIGLTLCATTSTFSSSRQERLSFVGLTGLAAIARYIPGRFRRWLTHQIYLRPRVGAWEPWALEQAASHEWRTVLEAGRAIGRFSSTAWIGEVDVPTSVIVTMRDRVVPLARQITLHRSIPGAEVYRVDGDHDACVAEAATFVPTLIRAITSVCERADIPMASIR
ncbi:MAG: Alpha/beta hydrolase [Ilumatobacteraceae bacterium]|nr:Alpha/beta hydrolase [Ilumatobacteraceae bacterium]